MQCAASLDSLLALSPKPSKTRKSKGTTIATVDNGSNNHSTSSTQSSSTANEIISGAVTTSSTSDDEVPVDGRTSSPLHPSLASRRRGSSSSSSSSSTSTNTTATTLESLDFQSSASTTELTTTTTTNTSVSKMNSNTNITDTAEPAPAAAAAASGKENAVNHSSSSNDGEMMTMTGKETMSNAGSTVKTTKTTTQSQKECSACHELKCRAEYSTSQWKKKKSNAASKGSGRRCIECISAATCNAATTSTHAQTRAMMAAAVAIGTVGAVCASTGTASTHNASGAKNNNKKKGLADRTNNNGNSNSDSAQEDEEDDLEMADVDVDDADEVMAKEDVDDEDENDNEEEDDDDDDDDDALTLTNFDHANASLLTVEQSPAKQETVENNNNNNAAAIEPIGVIHEEEQDVVVGIVGPTPRATDGQVFAGFSPVTTTTTTTTVGNTTVTANVNTNGEQEEQEVEDEALMSTYSFSLYEAEVSLEHIRSLQSTSSDDPANILTLATDALALPCFKADVLRDLTTASNKQTISGGESTPPPSAVCSSTVNSMASMFATHAAAMASSPFVSCTQDGFTSPSPAVASSSAGSSSAGSPLRLTGIDTRHLSDVYAQLQIVAAQSELALNDADAALTRMESILRGVAIEPRDASSPNQIGTSGILELGLVLSDAYWVVGDATKADAVRQILTDHATHPTSSDEADMAATGSTTISVENLAASLLKAMEPDDESEIELEPIVEAKEDVMSDDDKKATIPTITTTTTTTKHVHFDTSSADEVSPRSPVADELNDISGRKIASSILKGGGYPEAGTAEAVEKEELTIADGEPSRPDVVQHLYHNYRSSFEFGKNNIPVGGALLGLAESTASTSIKIASLGHLDLQAIDENFIGPHIVKGLDDVIANPAIETVGGIVDGIGGAVGAVISVLPFVGGGERSEEEKEA